MWIMNGFLAVDWLTLVCSFVFAPPVVSLTSSSLADKLSATDPSAIADLIEVIVEGDFLFYIIHFICIMKC